MVVPLAWTGGCVGPYDRRTACSRTPAGSFSGGIVSVLVFLRHLRFWSKAHGEVLRYSTLRQQLRHEDEPLIAGIVLIVLPAAGGKGQHGVLLTCGVGSDVIKVNIRDEAGRDLEDHIIAFHREVDIRVLLHIVRIGICDGVFLVQREEQMLTEVALTKQLYADILVLVVGQRDLFRRLQVDSVRKHLLRRRYL